MSASRTLRDVVAVGVLAVLATVVLPATVRGQGKVRLAVLNFQNNTTNGFWGDRLGEAAADEITTQLVKTGDFTVVERQQLKAVLDEQHLGLSGAVDPATAARIGKLLGVQAVVLGSITKFSINRKSGGIGPLSASYAEAESQMDVRLVNTTTGEIVVVAEGGGKKRFGGAAYKNVNFEQSFDQGMAQEALRPAIQEAVGQIADHSGELAAVAAEAATGQIVGERNGSVYLDKGANFGIKVGQQFDVMQVADTVRDAAGNVLDVVTNKVGVIKVTRVLSQSAICSVVEGKAQEGDRVRLSPPTSK